MILEVCFLKLCMLSAKKYDDCFLFLNQIKFFIKWSITLDFLYIEYYGRPNFCFLFFTWKNDLHKKIIFMIKTDKKKETPSTIKTKDDKASE